MDSGKQSAAAVIEAPNYLNSLVGMSAIAAPATVVADLLARYLLPASPSWLLWAAAVIAAFTVGLVFGAAGVLVAWRRAEQRRLQSKVAEFLGLTAGTRQR